MDHKCSLCNSIKFIEIKQIESSEIISKYLTSLNIDVKRFFTEKNVSFLKCIKCNLISYSSSLSGDSLFYNELQSLPFYYEEEKPEFNYAINKIIDKSIKKILDIGCGEGLFLKKIKNSFIVKGSEYNSKALNKLKALNIDLDTPDDKYDAIFSFQVLEHVLDVNTFLNNAKSKLNKGGFLFLTVPNYDSKYFKEVEDILNYPPHHLTLWDKKALESIANIFDLSIIDYYAEPMRLEHLYTLISSRRNKIMNNKFKLINNFIKILDKLLVPYYYDMINSCGHTHGMIYQKNDT